MKTCKKDCSPENKDKFLSEAGMLGGPAAHRGGGDGAGSAPTLGLAYTGRGRMWGAWWCLQHCNGGMLRTGWQISCPGIFWSLFGDKLPLQCRTEQEEGGGPCPYGRAVLQNAWFMGGLATGDGEEKLLNPCVRADRHHLDADPWGARNQEPQSLW